MFTNGNVIRTAFTAVGQSLRNTSRSSALAVGERPEQMSFGADGFFQQLIANRLLTLVLTPVNQGQ